MRDSGGDGWQGGSFAVMNSTSYVLQGEGAIVTMGTLGDGASGVEWFCLADGCYELDVGGGVAEAEMSFELVDTHGGHFQRGQGHRRGDAPSAPYSGANMLVWLEYVPSLGL